MAAGDCILSLAVEGGATKSVTLVSATRNKAKLATGIDSDAAWQVFEVNKLARVILSQANSQLQSEASWTPASFTAAT
jgi:hypothetical protein